MFLGENVNNFTLCLFDLLLENYLIYAMYFML